MRPKRPDLTRVYGDLMADTTNWARIGRTAIKAWIATALLTILGGIIYLADGTPAILIIGLAGVLASSGAIQYARTRN